MTNIAQRNQLVESALVAARVAARGRNSRACYDNWDGFQDAAMGLIQAAKTFSPQRGVPFSQYARRRAFGARKDGYARWRRKSCPVRLSPSRDGVARADPGLGSDYFEWMIRPLDGWGKDAFRLLFGEGLTVQEAAERLGVSGSAVRRVCRLGMQTLRVYLSEKGL